MKPWAKFQDWSILVLGAVLFLAPWLFGTTSTVVGSWNAWIVGIVFVVVSLLALARPSAFGYEWIGILAGVWLFFAPWFLGFAAVGAAAWTAWIIGILVVALALGKLQEVRNLQTQTSAF